MTRCNSVGRKVLMWEVRFVRLWLTVKAHRDKLPALTDKKLVRLVSRLVSNVVVGILTTMLSLGCLPIRSLVYSVLRCR